MVEHIIQLDNITKSFGNTQVLNGVSFPVTKGQFTAVVGKSGSGKSTLLGLISGLDKATGGQISVNGHDIAGMNNQAASEFRRDTIGIVFQGFHLIPSLTAIENVLLPVSFGGKRSLAQSKDYAHDLLEQVGLSHRLDHKPATLSGGEQQRVAIARALVNDAPILLADEPTGNLDEGSGKSILELLLNLCRDHGTTLLMVTHDKDISCQADTVITIKDGRADYA